MSTSSVGGVGIPAKGENPLLQSIKGHLKDKEIIGLLNNANAFLANVPRKMEAIADDLFTKIEELAQRPSLSEADTKVLTGLRDITKKLSTVLYQLESKTEAAASKAAFVSVKGEFTEGTALERAKKAIMTFCNTLKANVNAALREIGRRLENAIIIAKSPFEGKKAVDAAIKDLDNAGDSEEVKKAKEELKQTWKREAPFTEGKTGVKIGTRVPPKPEFSEEEMRELFKEPEEESKEQPRMEEVPQPNPEEKKAIH